MGMIIQLYSFYRPESYCISCDLDSYTPNYVLFDNRFSIFPVQVF